MSRRRSTAGTGGTERAECMGSVSGDIGGAEGSYGGVWWGDRLSGVLVGWEGYCLLLEIRGVEGTGAVQVGGFGGCLHT